MNKFLLSNYEYWLGWKFNAKITSSFLIAILCSIATLVAANYIADVNQTREQIGQQLLTLSDQTMKRMTEGIAEEVKLMEMLARSPSIIEAVKEANTTRADWTQSMIESQDKAWIENDPGIEATVQEIIDNQVSAYLIDFRKSNPEEIEIFVTDIKGLNVAMTGRTSDFLQSDEDWWGSAFSSGHGSTFVSPVEYDESTKTYAMKVGVAIKDPETDLAIGVLRGTFSISEMINTLAEVTVGTTSNVVLIDSQGIILYSRTPGFFMKPAPDFTLAVLQSGQRGWKLGNGLNGLPVIMGHSTSAGSFGQSLNWGMLITQNQSEVNQSILRNLLTSLLISLLIAGMAILISVSVLSHAIALPLRSLMQMAKLLSGGNLLRGMNVEEKNKIRMRKDEIGMIGQSFDHLITYLQEMGVAATAIASNDLAISITPRSESDELGTAFSGMVLELNNTMGKVAENAKTVAAAAFQVAASSDQSREATNQIATTIHQVSLGAAQQNEEVSKASRSMGQMGHAIEGVSQGAQEQARAASKASLVTAAINAAIEQVANNARSGVQSTAQTADAARCGVQTVEATIRAMQTIKGKVGLSAQKVREMGQRSEQIDTIVDTIDEIAAQTNLLALNAAIEAARVESKSENIVETLLQQHMLGAVNLVAEILASGRELASLDLTALARLARVEDLSISDPDGVVIAANQPSSVGFRYSEDARQQSSAFRVLLNQCDGIVICPIIERDQDGKPYIYVAVSRRDQRGIVQAGLSADAVQKLSGYSRGFAVVVNEVGKLAEHAKQSTREITILIRGLQKTVSEAVVVMEDGAHAVEIGAAQATESGKSLGSILGIAETVSHQVKEIAAAVQHISLSSSELVSAMETVNAVVEENTAATEEMAASSSELAQAVENIASVSEENSAVVEEVSALTEEVLTQAEQVSSAAASLTKMAQGLQKIVAQFNLGTNGTQE